MLQEFLRRYNRHIYFVLGNGWVVCPSDITLQVCTGKEIGNTDKAVLFTGPKAAGIAAGIWQMMVVKGNARK